MELVGRRVNSAEDGQIRQDDGSERREPSSSGRELGASGRETMGWRG